MRKILILLLPIICFSNLRVHSQTETDGSDYGFLQVINNHVKDQNVWTAAYYNITGIYIKKNNAKNYDLTKNYCSGGLKTDESQSIALESGLYDAKITIRRIYYVGGNSEDQEKEVLNVLIKADCTTKVFTEGSVEPPKCQPQKDRRDDD